MVGGEMFHQSCEREEEECEEEGVGADFAHAEFALGGDDEDGDAEVTKGVAVEKEGERVFGCGGGFSEFAQVDEGVGEGYDSEHL
jgi:hypothetical protein